MNPLVVRGLQDKEMSKAFERTHFMARIIRKPARCPVRYLPQRGHGWGKGLPATLSPKPTTSGRGNVSDADCMAAS